MKYTAAHWGTYEIHDNDLKPVGDDPAPSRIGKGWLSASCNLDSRILRPAIRKGWLEGDGGKDRLDDVFVEVSWDEAATRVAEELTRIGREHGNGAIYGGSYGWASAGRFHHAQSQLKRFLNLAGGFVRARETYSHAAGEVLIPHILGMPQGDFQDQMTSWEHITEHCTLLVAFGGISGRPAQVASSGTAKHHTENWLRQMKGRMINVSPQKSDMPNAEWVSIRPGTDAALMLALCHTLLVEGLHDEAFLTRYTSGWPKLCAYLLGESDGQTRSADWAAPICDVDAEAIRQLARDMASSRTMINVAWGVQRTDHGEQPIWAGLALASMLGQIGKPGTGYGFGYGCVASIGRSTKNVYWPSIPQGRNAVDDFIPVARVTDMLLHPGERYAYNGTTRTYPDIRMVVWSGGNPYHHHQDLLRLEKGWQKPETVVVFEQGWTATARRSDIVLPATTPLERTDIMLSKTEPTLIYMSPVHAPVGEAKDDHEILKLIAAKMGLEKAFTEGKSQEDWLRWLWDQSSALVAGQGMELPDFESFRQQGRFNLDKDEETRIALADFISDPVAHPLGTESGRITLFNEKIAAFGLDDCPGHPAWLQPVESTLDAPQGALHMISAQSDTRLHSQNDQGSESLGSKIEGREVCRLHPDTAAERGIAEGAIVRLFNSRGATLAGVAFDGDLRRDCIALQTGAWFDAAEVDGVRMDIHGNPNALTIDKGTSSLAQGNIGHTALVFVEPWTKPLPPLKVSKAPDFVER
ncbi:molybdopterin-dependent oxidoreductase [uncultured Cohaesibacter sp.]|uniref:molybdopterin-dependent oxidoreductase n=1 Tax=uncultured Cohaesibacter sp. TaxID=1002546 RepID=UPI0029C61DB8|nr:molybdopterin-dependent oxidoreductase [uncultured Cohaesibacter sp.]